MASKSWVCKSNFSGISGMVHLEFSPTTVDKVALTLSSVSLRAHGNSSLGLLAGRERPVLGLDT